ncbi:MAG: hypothetical protein E7311_04260 [Clostridiales bacterium]|nr:hypothetical protein [Clostridiales bacterium]
MSWKIPYEIMAEFVIVFKKIMKRSLVSRTVFDFFNWYYGIQNEYGEHVRLKPDEYTSIIGLIDSETQKRAGRLMPEMDSSLKAIGNEFDNDATARSIFMCSVVDRFYKENPEYDYFANLNHI